MVHQLRPQWGPATLVLEEQTKRSYQFQDGRLRKLKQGFYHMMTPYEVEVTRADIIREELDEMHKAVYAERRARRVQASEGNAVRFEEQVRVFLHLFPKGFQDPAYLDAWRAPVSGSSARRHVDSALAKARTALGRDALDQLLDADDHEGVIAALRTVYRETSLASPSKTIQPLEGLRPEKVRALATALRELLHGEDDFTDRFRGWLTALSGVTDVSWTAATLPAALFDPTEHAPIKPTVFQVQARVHGASPLTRKRPTPRGYDRMRRVALTTRDALVTRGLQPVDLLDIWSFCWETLRPRGQQLMRELGGSSRR